MLSLLPAELTNNNDDGFGNKTSPLHSCSSGCDDCRLLWTRRCDDDRQDKDDEDTYEQIVAPLLNNDREEEMADDDG